ncbi:MAG: helix-turn-helix domain-containing protein [Caulobacteraceae bacterium]
MSSDAAELDEDAIDVIIGCNIRIERRKSGLSQAALGRTLRCSQQQVQKYETGKNRVSVSQLIHLAGALGVSAEHLLPTSNTPSVGDVLLVPGAMELLDRFSVIESSEQKAAILEMIRVLGSG